MFKSTCIFILPELFQYEFLQNRAQHELSVSVFTCEPIKICICSLLAFSPCWICCFLLNMICQRTGKIFTSVHVAIFNLDCNHLKKKKRSRKSNIPVLYVLLYIVPKYNFHFYLAEARKGQQWFLLKWQKLNKLCNKIYASKGLFTQNALCVAVSAELHAFSFGHQTVPQVPFLKKHPVCNSETH